MLILAISRKKSGEMVLMDGNYKTHLVAFNQRWGRSLRLRRKMQFKKVQDVSLVTGFSTRLILDAEKRPSEVPMIVLAALIRLYGFSAKQVASLLVESTARFHPKG